MQISFIGVMTTRPVISSFSKFYSRIGKRGIVLLLAPSGLIGLLIFTDYLINAKKGVQGTGLLIVLGILFAVYAWLNYRLTRKVNRSSGPGFNAWTERFEWVVTVKHLEKTPEEIEQDNDFRFYFRPIFPFLILYEFSFMAFIKWLDTDSIGLILFLILFGIMLGPVGIYLAFKKFINSNIKTDIKCFVSGILLAPFGVLVTLFGIAILDLCL
ncbi:MAG: hypothetical protein HQK83_11730 [Fibrobacteria bacterium]|nr:hypothetical protein [Fibrobacteria bacterium]